MPNVIKHGQSALYIRDELVLDLQKFDRAKLQRWKDQLSVNTTAPHLSVTVAATHAGLITRNNAFYRPDIMKDGLPSFIAPFQKPVQIHHADHIDPIGRVSQSRYVDISNRYSGPIQQFTSRYGGSSFLLTDAKVDPEKAVDQVKWVIDNLMKMDSYQGLGYGELDLSISDTKAAEKIVDGRYLTVSVGFTTTEAYCSQCHQDWACDGPCEHTPGQNYDEYPMVLLPASFLYDEVSFVNNPADQFAQVTNVMVTNLESATTQQDAAENRQFLQAVPILLGVDGKSAVYRFNYQDSSKAEAQEVIVVSKKIETPELVEIDGVKLPKDAATKLSSTDATRVQRLALEQNKGGHKHRAIIDPATGNGHTDWVLGHSHDIVNNKVMKASSGQYDDKKQEYVREDPHNHKLGEELERLTDSTNKDGGAGPEETHGKGVKKKGGPGAKATPRGSVNKGKGKKLRKTLFGGGPGGTVDETEGVATGDETEIVIEAIVPADMDVPEGWEVVEDDLEDVEFTAESEEDLQELEDQAPSQSKGSKNTPKKMKKKKKSVTRGANSEMIEDFTDVTETDVDQEIPEGHILIWDETDTEDEEDFYDSFVVPELVDLGAEDAKLSTTARKKLSKGTFCGPNRSFPVPDCAHVTAARRLLGRAKVSAATKTKIRACVERKSRSLGCNKKTANTADASVVTFKIADQEYAVPDIAALNGIFAKVGKDAVVESKKALLPVLEVFGVDPKDFDAACTKDKVELGTGQGEALETAASRYEQRAGERFTDATVDAFVDALVQLQGESRNELVQRLLDSLVAKKLIRDFDLEYGELLEEKDELERQNQRLVASNKDLYLARQRFLAEKIVAIREASKADGYTELDDDSRENKVCDLQTRSVDSLDDTLEDLIRTVIGSKGTPGIEGHDDVQPGSQTNSNDADGNNSEAEPTPIDMTQFKDMSEGDYQAARQLQQILSRASGGTRQG